jgi:transposase
MAKPLSNDLRLRLIDYVQSGLSARSAGRKLSISASAATAIVKRWRTTGSYEALQMGGHRRPVLEKDRIFIEALLEKHDDWSEAVMAAHLRKERDVDVHPSTVGRFIRRLGWRYKKNGIRYRTEPRGCQGSQTGLEGLAKNLRPLKACVP